MRVFGTVENTSAKNVLYSQPKKKKKLIEQQPCIFFFFKSGKHMTDLNKVLMFETRFDVFIFMSRFS